LVDGKPIVEQQLQDCDIGIVGRRIEEGVPAVLLFDKQGACTDSCEHDIGRVAH